MAKRMKIETMLNNKINSVTISSPLSDKYIELDKDGQIEIRKIMMQYAKAAHEARKIYLT